MATSDAVAREAAWLATSGDSLPTLLLAGTNGAPFGVVQGYMPRTPGKRQAGQLYVLRKAIVEKRFANQRRLASYEFVLRLIWPLTLGTGNAEQEQSNFDAAVDKVLGRVGGFTGDKTHGGRFLSVAENPAHVTVRFDDPEHTLPTLAQLSAEVTYWADDFEITG